MAPLNHLRQVLLAGLLATGLLAPQARATEATATEEQVKAVFVYNFSHFVDWPPVAFATPTEPFVIGVFGNDGFAALLEQVVLNEQVNGHSILVRRFHAADAITPCQILFIDRTESPQLERVVDYLKGRGTLTVADSDDATQRGVMIQLAKVKNRIRLRINADSARANGLIMSSNLLRTAEIVRTGNPD